jgi:uracil DNA glycosylase
MQWAKQGVLLLNTVLTVAYARHDTTRHTPLYSHN